MTPLAKFLEIAYPGQPAFLKDEWIQGLPIRHVYMIGVLYQLAQRTQPTRPLRILEIGTWMGSSCLTWAEALVRFNNSQGSIVGIDPLRRYLDVDRLIAELDHADPQIVAGQTRLLKEMDEMLEYDIVHDLLMHNMKCLPPTISFTLMRKPSREALPNLQGQSFDLVYIDGSHAYGDVIHDVDWACKLAATGGVVCGDDLELQLHEVDRDFALAHKEIDFPTDPKTGRQYHPGVALAVAERLGPVANYFGFWTMWKTGDDTFAPMQFSSEPVVVPFHFSSRLRDDVLSKFRPQSAPIK